MFAAWQIYLVAAAFLGVALGLEGFMAGRRMSIVKHLGAVATGYVGVVANSLLAMEGVGLPTSFMGRAAMICLASIWISEWLAERRGLRPLLRRSLSTYVIAFAFGMGSAAEQAALIVIGYAEMIVLFVGRACASGETA